MIQRIHHVAYRCHDARETVLWYQKHLGMDFVLAIAEDQVPSTHAPDPYMHVFLDAGGGNILAFFELPNSPRMGRDANTPEWVQHIAFKVGSVDELRDLNRGSLVLQRLEFVGGDDDERAVLVDALDDVGVGHFLLARLAEALDADRATAPVVVLVERNVVAVSGLV